MDAKDALGRCLGGGYRGGKPHEALGFRCEVHEDVDGSLMVQLFGGYCFQFLWRESAKILFAPTFSVFCCLYVLYTPFVTEIYRVSDKTDMFY